MSFSLDKWYLDAVADDGRVVIAYRVDLRFAAVSLRIGSILERSAAGEVSQRSRAIRVPPLDHSPRGIAWDFPGLDFHARWEPSALPSFERTLFESGGRSIEWSCLAQNTPATIGSRGQNWSGRGYVEHLTTNFAPWKLPIDCLWWGRFTGRQSSLVWIRWDGRQPLTLILAQGREIPGEVFESGLRAADTSLDIDRGAVLRDGDIGAMLLGELPITRRIASRANWGTLERKWLSRGTLRRAGSPDETGWVIHERVWFHTDRAAREGPRP
jgi:hypothetical protein